MGNAYNPTHQLSKTAGMPIKLVRCWRDTGEDIHDISWRPAEPPVEKMISKSEIFNSVHAMIRKLASGKYRLYSRKKDPETGRRRNLGTFSTRTAAEKHERAVQFYKRH